ncbi:MAG: hypothetical protein IT452_09905 [Planctomycetia bacterium]|nr:hypothetical protein [Planctomycetia bacterium]
MSLSELGYPPVLTPRALEALNGRLPEDRKAELRRLSREAIDSVFLPFVERWKKLRARAEEEGVLRFFPMRLALNYRLLQLLDVETIRDWPDRVALLLAGETAESCRRLGVKPASVRRVLRLAGLQSRKLFSGRGQLARLPMAPGMARLRHLDAMLLDATRLDFALTAILLAVDGEIPAPAGMAASLMKMATSAGDGYRKHVSALMEPARSPDERWLEELRTKGLWLGFELRRVEVPSDPALPLPIQGPPLSQSLIEERR